MGANGLILALLFETLQAPDVALAQIIIGTVALPLMFFVILRAPEWIARRGQPNPLQGRTEMTARIRSCVFLLTCAGLVPAVAALIRKMPSFGAHPLPYGDLLNRGAPLERHISNAVSAVNFDYRGLDTLGEEFMLLSAVTGVVVLLRGKRGETPNCPAGQLSGQPIRPRSDAVSAITRLLGRHCAVRPDPCHPWDDNAGRWLSRGRRHQCRRADGVPRGALSGVSTVRPLGAL